MRRRRTRDKFEGGAGYSASRKPCVAAYHRLGRMLALVRGQVKLLGQIRVDLSSPGSSLGSLPIGGKLMLPVRAEWQFLRADHGGKR
jgi:hypothetical protein